MKDAHKITTFLATAFIVAAFAFVVCNITSDISDAAAGTEADPILVLPGQTWQYTPTFPAGLSPVLTVSASATAQPGTTATYASTSGYASVSGGTASVVFPANAPVGKYYVTIKAATTQPTQVSYQNVVFSVQDKITGTGGTLYAAVGGVQDPFSVSAGKAATYTLIDYGTLINGSSKVSVDSSTGAITVTGLVSGDIGTHTLKVKAIATDNPTNEVVITVTLNVKPQIAFTSSPAAGFVVLG